MARNFYRWIKEYSPPPLPVQISVFATLAGILCIAISIYLGWDAVAGISLSWDNWLSVLPLIAGNFVRTSKDLLVVGACFALSGRALRWYFERDARLLHNVALIVLIGWSRQILHATSEILVNPKIGYEALIFSIVTGILIGIASFLVILVVHRSAKGFFKETVKQVEEFEES